MHRSKQPRRDSLRCNPVETFTNTSLQSRHVAVHRCTGSCTIACTRACTRAHARMRPTQASLLHGIFTLGVISQRADGAYNQWHLYEESDKPANSTRANASWKTTKQGTVKFYRKLVGSIGRGRRKRKRYSNDGCKGITNGRSVSDIVWRNRRCLILLSRDFYTRGSFNRIDVAIKGLIRMYVRTCSTSPSFVSPYHTRQRSCIRLGMVSPSVPLFLLSWDRRSSGDDVTRRVSYRETCAGFLIPVFFSFSVVSLVPVFRFHGPV